MKITIQDAIQKAIRIRGLNILKDKKRFLILLEDLAPILAEEREFLEKVYQNETGKILYEVCRSKAEEREMYLREADAYLKDQYGFNRSWRERLFSCFDTIQIRRAVFRVLSQGEARRDLEVYAPEVLTGVQISKHLPPEPLLKLLYSEARQKLGIRNLSMESWTVVGPDGSWRECPPGKVQELKKDMMIRIIPKTAQLNVLEIQES